MTTCWMPPWYASSPDLPGRRPSVLRPLPLPSRARSAGVGHPSALCLANPRLLTLTQRFPCPSCICSFRTPAHYVCNGGCPLQTSSAPRCAVPVSPFLVMWWCCGSCSDRLSPAHPPRLGFAVLLLSHWWWPALGGPGGGGGCIISGAWWLLACCLGLAAYLVFPHLLVAPPVEFAVLLLLSHCRWPGAVVVAFDHT